MDRLQRNNNATFEICIQQASDEAIQFIRVSKSTLSVQWTEIQNTIPRLLRHKTQPWIRAHHQLNRQRTRHECPTPVPQWQRCCSVVLASILLVCLVPPQSVSFHTSQVTLIGSPEVMRGRTLICVLGRQTTSSYIKQILTISVLPTTMFRSGSLNRNAPRSCLSA